MKIDRLIKIIASICFVLITAALVVARNSPATGYEASIYTATPPLVWIFLGLSIVCGIAITIHQLYTKHHELSKLWVIGLLLILVSYTVILSLHIVRGYAFWNAAGDSGTHLGTVKSIVVSGYIDGGNIYPIATIYAAQLSQICDLSPIVFLQILPVLFALIYVAFMYLLAKSVLPYKGAVILAAVAAVIPLYGATVGFFPNHLAHSLFPMALFLLVKSFSAGAWQWRTLFILMVFLFPVFHPVPTAILAVFLVTIPLARVVFDKVAKSGRKIIDSSVKFSAVALVVLLIWGGGWFSSSPGRVQGFLDSLTAEQYATPAEPTSVTGKQVSHFVRLISRIRYAQWYGYSVMEQFFKVYGGIAAYMLLALIAVPILWRRISTQADLRNLTSLYVPMIAIGTAVVALYFTAVPFGPTRLLFYIALISTILVGFVLFKFICTVASSHARWMAKVATCGMVVLLVGVSLSGILKVYASPYVLLPSYHTTQTEIDGMDWFFHNKDTATPITGLTISAGRFADFLLTPEEKGQHNIPRYMPEQLRLPYHFGYDEHPQLGESYAQNTYLVLNKQDRLLYVEVFPEIEHLRYSPSEFEKLERDPSVSKLYSNGGLDVYYIHAHASPT